MPEHILFLTGKLAEPALHQVLEEMQPTEFTYTVRQIGVNVAALMTDTLIRKRLADAQGADRIILPGRVRGDIAALSTHYRVPVIRGPEELKDIPSFFGRGGKPVDLSRYEVRIFAEIVDAPDLTVDAIARRASEAARDGANVIDLGCLPNTPFPRLEDAIARLHEDGLLVSVDSMETGELLRGGRAGADFLLSLREETLWLAQEVAATPVLIPEQPGDLDSLYRAMEALEKSGRPYIADPILDPIHYGFTDSLVRYHAVRQRYPEAAMMMGTGNLSELTEADTTGIHAILMGIISELRIGNILTTQVSPHARSAIRECDAARRIMFAAREEKRIPRGYSDALMGLHARAPFPFSTEEIRQMAAAIKDPSFRVQISAEGIHVFNRDGMHVGPDPFTLFPYLHLEQDGGHAFYMGVELARAQIAWQLGKRYTQDTELAWGCALPPREVDMLSYCAPGATMKKPGNKENQA